MLKNALYINVLMSKDMFQSYVYVVLICIVCVTVLHIIVMYQEPDMG